MCSGLCFKYLKKMAIPLFVLVLQIGFNTALNNRDYNSNSVIPLSTYVNSGQTRRIPDHYNYMSLSSRGIPESDEQTDFDSSNSAEEYGYRSVRPLHSRSRQRKNNYLSQNIRRGNDVSLEAAPVRSINSNNYADTFQQPPYISRQADPYFRRSYLRNSPSNNIPSHTRQFYRKINDDLSHEVSSHEVSSRLGEEATYLRSLLSLIEQPSNRRGQNRIYYSQGNSLSSGLLPIDKLYPSEEAHDSLPNSFNKRRNNNPDSYANSIILVKDDDQPDETPKSVNSQSTGLGYNTLLNRRYDDEPNPYEDFYYLSPFHGPNFRQREQKLTNNSPFTRKLFRESNSNADVESPLNDQLLTDSDKTEKLTVLRLASLEDLSHSNNRKSNHKNFLRLSLSPGNKLILDEGVASDLSEILSETLDELNLAPVNLKRTDVTSNKFSRGENNGNIVEEDNINKMFLLRLGNSYNSNNASQISVSSRYKNPNSNYGYSRTHGNHTREKLNGNINTHNKKTNNKKLFDECAIETSAVETLVPYHEGKINKLLDNITNEGQNNSSQINDIIPSSLLSNNYTLPVIENEDNASSNLTDLSLETPLLKNSDESLPKNTTDEVQLEFPWNGQMSSDNDKSKSELRSDDKKDKTKDTNDNLHLVLPLNDAVRSDSDKGKSELRSDDKKDKTKDTTDNLHLEFPWNDVVGPDSDKGESELRSDDKKDKTEDTTDNLHIEFPWNDVVGPDSDKGESELRSDDKKDKTEDTTDNLHIEFPWNDVVGPESDKGKSELRSDDKKDKTTDTTENLHLEFPWNDVVGPESDKGKSELRSDDKKDKTKDITDNLHLEFPWNDVVGPDSDKGESKLRSDDKKDKTEDSTDNLHLEFPWNDVVGPESDKGKSELRSDDKKDKTKDTTDNLHLEFPWNDVVGPESDKGKSELRSDDKKDKTKDTTDNLHLEFPWNDVVGPESDKGKSELRSDDKKDKTKDTTDNLHLEFPWNDVVGPDSDKGESELRSDDKKDKTEDTTDNLHLEFPWNDVVGPESDKGESELRSDDKKDKTEDTTDNLHLEFPWNDVVGPEIDKGKSELRSDDKKDKTKDTTDNLHLEFPWNDALSPNSNQEKTQLRTDETKDKTNDSTDTLNLEFPRNEVLSPDADKDKSQLKNNKNVENTIDNVNTLDLEFPWNNALSPDSHKSKSLLRSKNETKNTTDTLNLEFPWNEQLSPDKTKAGEPKPQSHLRSQASGQDKDPKDERNEKTSTAKPSTKHTTPRLPDPFFIHPYLRNRNVIKHPNYFRRSYDEFTEGLRLQKLKDKKSSYHSRPSNRRRNDNLGVIGLARRFSERRRQRLPANENTPPLVITTSRPKHSRSLYYAGRAGHRETLNDTIIFPNN
ncbi:hypothetical protein PYW08_008512 [Mythimna loreyi]|uniref:Uncharacterized protein n=1 Tax=Mythimna loreyi TaxID=667449 RepID=A0ACC2Q8U1_9NEOP|nr:hypothetical protein PYW08_008512 [Mythimna loreyi]